MGSLGITLNCGSKDECLDLLDYILNYRGIKGTYIMYSVDDGKLRIWVSGAMSEAVITKRVILKAYKEWKELKAWEKGVGSIDINLIMKLIGKPFVSEALVELLKILGYKAELKEGVLYTNASSNDVLELARELSSSLEKLVKFRPKASYASKALITAYATLKGADPLEVIKELEGAGVLEVRGHKVLVKEEWRNLLRRLASRI